MTTAVLNAICLFTLSAFCDIMNNHFQRFHNDIDHAKKNQTSHVRAARMSLSEPTSSFIHQKPDAVPGNNFIDLVSIPQYHYLV